MPDPLRVPMLSHPVWGWNYQRARVLPEAGSGGRLMTGARDGKCGAGDNRAAAMSEPRATLSGVDASNGGEAGIRTLRWRLSNLVMARDFWL